MVATNELLAIRAAELYYEERKSQDEVGQILGITRWKVGRLLAFARDQGFVRIEIAHPRARRLALERTVEEKFGLEDVVIVSTASLAKQDELQSRLAQAAADYLTALRPFPRTLGVSWGRTLQEIASFLPQGWANGVNVVQINGGVSLNLRAGTAAATAFEFAHRGGGSATLLPSPAILERVETKLAIEHDRIIAGVLEMARSADTYLFSAGSVDHTSVHVDSGYLTLEDVSELRSKGAVGDVVGRYIDADGNIVDPSLNERTVGITLAELRKADRTVFVAAGRHKHPVAAAVVRSGICKVLITDENTARHLLETLETEGDEHGSEQGNDKGQAT